MATSNTTSISFRLKQPIGRQLDRIAKRTGQSRTVLAAQAISDFVKAEDWQIKGIKQALASLDAGKGVPHEKVKKWIASWGSKRPLKMPK